MLKRRIAVIYGADRNDWSDRAAGWREYRISVRNLVEFIFRSGDIDNRIGKGAQKEAMQEGSRIHRKIQGRMGMEYRAVCVPLKPEVPQEQYVLALEGRADGIITNADGVTVDEIKCMYTDVTRFEKPIFVHKAQAMCYAYIYALQNGLDQISVQLTYCDRIQKKLPV